MSIKQNAMFLKLRRSLPTNSAFFVNISKQFGIQHEFYDFSGSPGPVGSPGEDGDKGEY